MTHRKRARSTNLEKIVREAQEAERHANRRKHYHRATFSFGLAMLCYILFTLLGNPVYLHGLEVFLGSTIDLIFYAGLE